MEGRFRFLKDSHFVGPIFSTKADADQGFAFLMVMALLLYSTFEYMIQEQMAKETEPLFLPGKEVAGYDEFERDITR